MEVGGENWIIPINAVRSDADIESEAVSLRSMGLQVSKARQLGSHRLVDASTCDNPFADKMKRSRDSRSASRIGPDRGLLTSF